jgi:hypothetical protein
VEGALGVKTFKLYPCTRKKRENQTTTVPGNVFGKA